jgi:hypothetical protein
MLSNGQHRSVLQTKKIQNMLKQVPACTLSPETSTITSSGYSTGGSSVSTTINQSLKKSSSSSIASKQHHHQQQEHKTKSKGKKKEENNARGVRTYLRSSYFNSASTDDIYYIFLIYTSS